MLCCINNSGGYEVFVLGNSILNGNTYQENTSYPFVANLPIAIDASVQQLLLPNLVLNQNHVIEVGLRNNGLDTITSLDLHWQLLYEDAGTSSIFSQTYNSIIFLPSAVCPSKSIRIRATNSCFDPSSNKR